MYSIEQYGGMLKDELRMNAYEEAIKRTVQPGSVVLDIGTGTGIHALMAARTGARHVYAIEPADAIHVARNLARVNGLEDRITFIQDMSIRVTLPEKADVLISDLHGTLPWFGKHIPTMADARERLLTNQAVILPAKDTVHVVVVEAPKLYSSFSEPWEDRPFGFEMDTIARLLTNSFARGRVDRDAFLSPVQTITEVDYYSVQDPDVDLSQCLRIDRPGLCHGLLFWFDTQVHQDIRLTSAPYEPEISYGSAFFPLTRPVEVARGDRMELRLKGVLQGDDYLWIWDTRIIDEAGATRVRFQQNTLATQLSSLESLRKRAPSFRPQLGPRGELDKKILDLMDGELTLEGISERIASSWTGRLPTGVDVLERVRTLSEKYG